MKFLKKNCEKKGTMPKTLPQTYGIDGPLYCMTGTDEDKLKAADEQAVMALARDLESKVPPSHAPKRAENGSPGVTKTHRMAQSKQTVTKDDSSNLNGTARQAIGAINGSTAVALDQHQFFLNSWLTNHLRLREASRRKSTGATASTCTHKSAEQEVRVPSRNDIPVALQGTSHQKKSQDSHMPRRKFTGTTASTRTHKSAEQEVGVPSRNDIPVALQGTSHQKKSQDSHMPRRKSTGTTASTRPHRSAEQEVGVPSRNDIPVTLQGTSHQKKSQDSHMPPRLRGSAGQHLGHRHVDPFDQLLGRALDAVVSPADSRALEAYSVRSVRLLLEMNRRKTRSRPSSYQRHR